jgi:DNA-binding response OmpR family regulator
VTNETANVPTVLIVDDDVVLARAFVRALVGEGYKASAVHSADEALRVLQAGPPDAIILDFRMPLINGVGFLYRLRSHATYQNIPVMVVTGESFLSDEVKAELKELGADLRVKPLGLADFVSATRALLGRRASAAAAVSTAVPSGYSDVERHSAAWMRSTAR